MIFPLGQYAAINSDSTVASTKVKRWGVSMPRYIDLPDTDLWKITVTSGVILGSTMQRCMEMAGENWAAAFVSNLREHYLSAFPLGAMFLDSVNAFYPTSGTQTLYCTTLAGEFFFTSEAQARNFRDIIFDYMMTKKRDVAPTEPAAAEISDAFELNYNVTQLAAAEGKTCSMKGCSFNFGHEDTGICHDNWDKISQHALKCTKWQ